MHRRLEPERMTDSQLWDRATLLIDRAGPLHNRGPQDLDLSLQQLKAVLEELHFRAHQLQLFTAAAKESEPGESAGGVGAQG